MISYHFESKIGRYETDEDEYEANAIVGSNQFRGPRSAMIGRDQKYGREIMYEVLKLIFRLRIQFFST